MFEREFSSLAREIAKNDTIYIHLSTEYPSLRQHRSSQNLVDDFHQSKDVSWQSSVINAFIQASVNPSYQQFSYLIITALFWRNLTYLSGSCGGRNIHPEDLLSQGNLILLQLVTKAGVKHPQEKIYANLSRSLRRDFYIWVKANDQDFDQIPETQVQIQNTPINTEKIIKRILAEKVLKKADVDLWLEVERDDRTLKEVAAEKGLKYDAFQKRIRRIQKKIEAHKK